MQEQRWENGRKKLMKRENKMRLLIESPQCKIKIDSLEQLKKELGIRGFTFTTSDNWVPKTFPCVLCLAVDVATFSLCITITELGDFSNK